MARALSTLAIASAGIMPIYCFNLFLSIVRICSSKTIDSLSSPSKFFTSVCVGNFAFVCVLPVIAAMMTVGLNQLPVLLDMISTGRVPPCSEPITGVSSA